VRFTERGPEQISHVTSEKALLASCNVHEGGLAFNIVDSFLFGGNAAKPGGDGRLEATFVSGPTKNYVGGGVISFGKGLPLLSQQNLAS